MQNESLELRILNGLQAGARLRLSEGQFLLGTSEECDVIISGRGVEAQAAEIEVREGQILLSTLQLDFSPRSPV